MDKADVRAVFKSICDRRVDATFVGKKVVKDFLCYVLGNGVKMECRADSGELTGNEEVVIFDDVTVNTLNVDICEYVPLSRFVEAFNNVEIPEDRIVALWGGGKKWSQNSQ